MRLWVWFQGTGPLCVWCWDVFPSLFIDFLCRVWFPLQRPKRWTLVKFATWNSPSVWMWKCGWLLKNRGIFSRVPLTLHPSTTVVSAGCNHQETLSCSCVEWTQVSYLSGWVRGQRSVSMHLTFLKEWDFRKKEGTVNLAARQLWPCGCWSCGCKSRKLNFQENRWIKAKTDFLVLLPLCRRILKGISCRANWTKRCYILIWVWLWSAFVYWRV